MAVVSRSHYIFEELLQSITEGRWKAGEYLPTERDLAHQYQASRNTIREALKMLAALNYIQLQNRKPALVCNQPAELIQTSYKVNPAEFLEIQEARYHLEYGLIPRLIRYSTPKDIDKLREINKQFLETRDVQELANIDYHFHVTLVTISQNNFVRHIYLSTLRTLKQILVVGKVSKEGIYVTYKAHNNLIDALESKNHQALELAIELHFRNGTDFLSD